jgi:hypothetical protein
MFACARAKPADQYTLPSTMNAHRSTLLVSTIAHSDGSSIFEVVALVVLVVVQKYTSSSSQSILWVSQMSTS